MGVHDGVPGEPTDGAEQEATTPPQRKRRTRTKHPGVKLKERHRNGVVTHYARWNDPDSGLETNASLDKLGLKSNEARREWAVRKSQELLRRKAALAAGASPFKRIKLETVIVEYLRTAKTRLAEGTIEVYESAVKKFQAWAEHMGVKLSDDVSGEHLARYHRVLSAQPVRRAVKGGKRGERREAARARNPNSVNRELRAVKRMLNVCRPLGYFPKLTSDSIRDALPQLPTPKQLIEFLRAEDCVALLEAAHRCDLECFALTREEKKTGVGGLTPKHVPIARFVAFVLLTGCRLNEAVTLEWSNVHLLAKDDAGEIAGEIRMPWERVKTKRERIIDLSVSPFLRRMLTEMKVRAGSRRFVFGNDDDKTWTKGFTKAACDRLSSEFGAPEFTWQMLRQTCGTFLTNAPGIFGAASAYRSARQLGHSVAVAEKHYLGVLRGISREAKTLDEAMEIKAVLEKIVKIDDPGNEASSRALA